MAVAPVTNWLFYDSIYTERYMGLPATNIGGYETSSVLNVTALGKVDFLLAHGSGDDNVHYMNSASLLDKLTQKHVRGWRFRMFTDRFVFRPCPLSSACIPLRSATGDDVEQDSQDKQS